MKIDEFTEQRIKDAADIVDVVSDFIILKKKGVNYQCLCPFHDDRHIGSFVVHPAGNCYRCFSCDAKGGPVDFLMNYAKMTYPDALMYLANKYGIYVSDPEMERWKHVKPAQPRELKELESELPEKTWPTSWVGYYKNLESDKLVQWMLNDIKWDAYQRANLVRALNDYHVGHCHHEVNGYVNDWTIWWQIDDNNVLHNGHMMRYGSDGHRDKANEYNQTWLHAIMRKASGEMNFDDSKMRASYCLFGQHLLNAYPRAAVKIVESEKTAVLMASAYGNDEQQVWMACSGLQNLKRERLLPLIAARREIILFPDRDGIARWKRKAAEIGYEFMKVNTDAVVKWWQPCDGDKADIADVILRHINMKR